MASSRHAVMRSPIRHAARSAVLVLALALVACAPAGGGSGTPMTAAEAVSLALAQQSRFAGIGPLDENMIGQAAWYEVEPSGDGWQVLIRIGWGDCPAGCIDRHRWAYSVSRDGAVTLTSETGPPVPSGIPGRGGGGTTGGILPGGTGIQGHALAGPTCPVVSVNDPSCDDRPVAGATILVLDARGTEVARLVTDANGHYEVALPSGPYTIEPQPVEGFFRQAEPMAVTVGDGIATVDIGFDTGIR